MPDLGKIKTFAQLIKYLDEELDWPIDDMDIEDIDDAFFEYDPESDLGLDPNTAAKIKSIKQLRPLTSAQPFGIFFVEFEPKRLPVTALRRILGRLVTKKRATANPSDRATWNQHDLIFASVYGDDDTRRIDFAHFADDADNGLPTLRVLGWDDDDTHRKQEWVERRLREHLSWPDKESSSEWRIRWREAFILGHREAIRTSKELAASLAALAQRIRKRVLESMEAESKTKGPLHKLHKAFQDSLIHDLDQARFADMYAQTIAYGLLSARMSRPAGLTADDAALMVPNTNPFLKELMDEFLRLGGRDKRAANGKGIDFDELGVNDVVDLLKRVKVEAVVADFGRERPGEDPVIHFYEYFMQVYDKKEKVKRGVFYTPKPVVSFIVRSVDEILREEFGLPLGLADTTTWGEIAEAKPEIKIPSGVKPTDHFVQILDPATGTGTFLVETIDLIHSRMVEHWQKEGKKSKAQIEDLWNEYVPEHLLPRLYGFELMMAPYAIAHMKIGLKLGDTGYRFQSEQRLRVYLTNTLEPSTNLNEMLEFVAPFLAHEARAANAVKRSLASTIILGNPPYSVYSANDVAFANALMDDYKQIQGVSLGERRIAPLMDDYCKFLRFADYVITRQGVGVVAMITNHGYLSGPVFRGMRASVLSKYNVEILDLHGDYYRGDPARGDTNIFEIKPGVAISIWTAVGLHPDPAPINYGELRGDADEKLKLIGELGFLKSAQPINPVAPLFLFVPGGTRCDTFEQGISVDQIFEIGTLGMMTAKDDFIVDFSRDSMVHKMRLLADKRVSDANIRARYDLHDNPNWTLESARRIVFDIHKVQPLCYRPFDIRYTYYDKKVLARPQRTANDPLLLPGNLALCVPRQLASLPFRHCFVSNHVTEMGLISNRTKEANRVFPLYRESGKLLGRTLNISGAFIEAMRSLWRTSFSPEACFACIYAQLHSPSYRELFADQLLREFPRVLVPATLTLADHLAESGSRLIGLHTLERTHFSRLETKTSEGATGRICEFHHSGDREVRRVGEKGRKLATSPQCLGFGRVCINDTAYFDGVPEADWNFHIGGYQVCHKWLKDRKGRTLSDEDLAHYHKIVIALSETIRIMGEIDKVIEEHGGWPGAFITDPAELERLGLKPGSGTATPAPRNEGEEPTLPFA